MGLLKKLFSDAADELKKSLEETKKEMRNSLEEMKQNAMAGFADGASKYAKKLKDYEARLREMPEDKKGVYGEVSEGTLSGKSTESHQKEPVAQENVVSGLTQLDGLVQQIKERIQSQGMSVFVLYANDYEGDREYEEVEQLGDEGLLESSSEYAINYNDSYDGYSSVYTKVRKIEVQDSGVTFDIEEIYEDNDGNEESRGFHEAQTIDRILESCSRDTVERGLENILTYLNDETLIKLNKNTGNESMPDPVSEPKSEPEAETKVEVDQKGDPIENGGLFSARLEAMIAAALQDGVLTDKERELLKRRVEKEGEDWDEVEMIIESRLAEMKSALPSVHATSANATAEKDYTEETGAEKMRSLSQADEKDIPSTQETVVDASKETDGTGLIVYENGETDVLNADCNEIVDEQFDHCDIVKVILPSGIKRIGKDAFNFCEELKVVDLSGCVELKVIDDDAFYGCANLESLIISQCKKLERIGCHAFCNNKILRKVIFPVSIKSIDGFAFEDCGLEEIDFSQCLQLESIGSLAFSGSQLRQVVFPASLKEISDAFVGCEKLEILDFSSCTQLEYVHSQLFRGLNNIKVIDFSNCEKLNLSPLDIYNDFEKIILPPGQTSFNAMCIWDQLGYNIDKSLCHFQRIKKEAFSGMEEIKEMEIPDTVEEIELNAFKGCKQLKTIVLPASLKKMDSLGWGLERLKKLDFSKVTQLKKIPENVVSECPKLRELTIPNGVVEIEDDAFSEASNLRTLFLPPTLEEIGELGLKKLDIYCFSPAIEELTPLVVAIFDNEEEDEEEDDEEKKKIDPKSYRINLFVLPQYVEKYISQRNAERIPEDVLVIKEIPEEFRYYYDN